MKPKILNFLSSMCIIFFKLGYFTYSTFKNLAGLGYELRLMSQDNKLMGSDIWANLCFLNNVNFFEPCPCQEKIFDGHNVFFPDIHCVKYFLMKHYLVHSQGFIEKSLENTYQFYNNLIKSGVDNVGVDKAEFDKFYSFYFKLNTSLQ
jgi:hypothetical protein